jgi:hypothetical protein
MTDTGCFHHQQKIFMLEQQIQQLQQQEPPTHENKDRMLEEMASFFLFKLEKNENLYERLPIRRIDGLKLDVFIKSFKNHSNIIKIYLLIEDAMPEVFCLEDDCVGYHEYFRKDFNTHEANHTEIKKILEQVLVILNNLEFCKLRGVLFEKGKRSPDISLLWKNLITAENIEWKVKECCVCLEETFSSTICDHPLCRCCFQKLKKSKCPTCRQPLSFDDDDDSDEENNS